MIRLYFKKDDVFVKCLKTDRGISYLNGKVVNDFEGAPFIEVDGDPDLLLGYENLKSCFLKATSMSSPQYLIIGYRAYGDYQYGKATGTLIPGLNTQYWLNIETKDWDGIADMQILQKRLWAGTICPKFRYKKE